MNVVILTGRLTAEPELRYTQQNVPCTSFNLAVDRASKGDDADFPTIVAWRETAEFACKYLYKGSRIVVRGEIRTRTYPGSDGKNHKVTEVQDDRAFHQEIHRPISWQEVCQGSPGGKSEPGRVFSA